MLLRKLMKTFWQCIDILLKFITNVSNVNSAIAQRFLGKIFYLVGLTGNKNIAYLNAGRLTGQTLSSRTHGAFFVAQCNEFS